MERIPQGGYTPEFRLQAVKLVATGLSIPEARRRLSIPKSSLHKWVSADRQGKLANVGKGSGYRANKKWTLAACGGSWQKQSNKAGA